MSDIFLIDPLGRRITFHDSTWFGHIMKRHPDMRMLRETVQRAIEDPLAICFSRSDPDCRIYFGATSISGILVAVVADVVDGFVKTAYRAVRVKGDIEWSPPTP